MKQFSGNFLNQKTGFSPMRSCVTIGNAKFADKDCFKEDQPLLSRPRLIFLWHGDACIVCGTLLCPDTITSKIHLTG